MERRETRPNPCRSPVAQTVEDKVSDAVTHPKKPHLSLECDGGTRPCEGRWTNAARRCPVRLLAGILTLEPDGTATGCGHRLQVGPVLSGFDSHRRLFRSADQAVPDRMKAILEPLTEPPVVHIHARGGLVRFVRAPQDSTLISPFPAAHSAPCEFGWPGVSREWILRRRCQAWLAQR